GLLDGLGRLLRDLLHDPAALLLAHRREDLMGTHPYSSAAGRARGERVVACRPHRCRGGWGQAETRADRQSAPQATSTAMPSVQKSAAARAEWSAVISTGRRSSTFATPTATWARASALAHASSRCSAGCWRTMPKAASGSAATRV